MFSVHPSLAQNTTIDSLKKVLLTTRQDTNKVNALNALTRQLYETGNFDTSLICAGEAKTLAEKIAYKRGIAVAYNNIGLIYSNKGNYPDALKNYFAALKIREEIKDKQGIAASYNSIGRIYYFQGNYPDALKNYFASLKIAEEIKDKQGIAVAYNNIGLIYCDQGNYPEALKNYFAALKIEKEIKYQEGIASSYNNIGDVYAKQKKFVEAEALQHNALTLAREIGNKRMAKHVYESFCDLYEQQGNYKKAYQYHRFYSLIKDSILNEKTNKQMNELKIKYETEKKEKEIAVQSHKLSEQNLLLKRNRLFLLLLAIGALLLLMLGWIIFSRYRIKKESQIKSEMLSHQQLFTKSIIETQENERKRIAQDLHDGIGHKLTALKLNFENIAHHSQTRTISLEEKTIFQETENILDETHKEVRVLSHSMMPKALQERELTDAVSDLVEQTLAHSTLKYSLKNNLPATVPSTIQVCLYRVLQELLSNTLKHACATELAIQLFKNANTIIMMVEDNGTGIKNKSATNGIGLHNIAGRVKAVNGIFTIESGPVKGTIATVRIPYNN